VAGPAEIGPVPETYTAPLSITSQFLFCGLPLRLDSYRGCAFRCTFCFARNRGGNTPAAAVAPAPAGALGRVLERALRDEAGPHASMVGQFLRARVPIHFGGMSDPFQPAERVHRVSAAYLRALAAYRYPMVLSTRGPLVAEAPYLPLLRDGGPVVVQFSFTSTRTAVARRFEPWATPPGLLLRAMERLARAGVPVTCRWQPYILGAAEPPREFVARVTAAGAAHVALEHLKVPVERNHLLWARFASAFGADAFDRPPWSLARRDGREYVLPAAVKLPAVAAFCEAVRAAGATAGVADNDLQYLSDGACCCSGVDRFPGFEGWFKHQIGHAVRRCRGRPIRYAAVAGEWLPSGPIDRWLNSHTRIGRRLGCEGSMRDHLRHRWNTADSGFSPASFYGVEATDRFDADGYRIYRWSTGAARSAPDRTQADRVGGTTSRRRGALPLPVIDAAAGRAVCDGGQVSAGPRGPC
jgi:DNA repair photolyase